MKFFKVSNSRSLILLIILKLMILEKFSSVSVEPFFRKKKIDFEEKIFDMMDKYASNSTIKHITQNKEKNKEIKYLNKNNFDSNEIYLKNSPPLSEKKIQSDIKKIGKILNIKDKKIPQITENKSDNRMEGKRDENINNYKSSSNSELKISKKEKPLPTNLKISDKEKNEFKKPLENNLPIKKHQLKQEINNVRSESIEFGLPEINISDNRKIENFFPYFLKANLIRINSQPSQIRHNYNAFNHYLEYKDLRSIAGSDYVNLSCLDTLCEVCEVNNKLICLQCQPGHFLLEGKCYNSCPPDYNADVYKRECVPLAIRQRNTFSRTTYLKAFTIGSCKNMCGKIAADCSCQPDCNQYGNCCSDYRNCELLVRNNANKAQECQKLNSDCELCIDIEAQSNKCGQCKPGYFLREDQCVKFCDFQDKAHKENYVCYLSKKCLVDNCMECENDNPSVCKKCFNGFFLNNNMCHLSCPGSLRADRMNWICMDQSVFAWYWIFPSKTSCRNKCDMAIGTNGIDCSCREDCISYGNCCQDIEDYCYKFIIN